MRDQYIQIRNSIFEAQKNNTPANIQVEWFYNYYVEKFKNQPKTRKFYKKDMYDDFILDDNYDFVWEEVETRLLSYPEFAQQFSIHFMGHGNEILEILDAEFNLSWLYNKNDEKIKLVIK